MGRHHPRQPRVDQALERDEVLQHEIGERPGVLRQLPVAVAVHAAVPREVLAHRRHAGAPRAPHPGPPQGRDLLGGAPEGAVADDAGAAAAEVEHGGEGQVHVEGAQLRRHQPAQALGGLQRRPAVPVPQAAEGGCGRKPREAGAEALHAPALLVDGDQEPWSAQGVDLARQRRELLRRLVVAVEQDDAPHQRMAQELARRGVERQALDADHDRPEHLSAPAGARPGGRAGRRRGG